MENRIFLRQALEARLVALYVEQKSYTEALTVATPLLRELKKIDDKALLVEVTTPLTHAHILYFSLPLPFSCYHTPYLTDSNQVQLVESRAYQKLGNITKSRAALTSAKTTANGIYCPPKLQAFLDLQSGTLNPHHTCCYYGY